MGNCLDCFRETGEARDPIMDAQARRRAADAAQARAQQNQQAQGRGAKKAASPARPAGGQGTYAGDGMRWQGGD